jgi:NADPH2:quinone reductase
VSTKLGRAWKAAGSAEELSRIWAGSGGYAEEAVAAVASLHGIPDHLTSEAAVAMIGTGRTAVGVLEVAGLTSKDVVLVTAAAGGLGSLFLQAARNAGATVIGVAGGTEKTAIVRSLGADVAVDYLQPAWAEQVRSSLDGAAVSIVLDGVGGALGRAALELLGVGGRIVIFGWSAGEPTQVTTQDLNQRGLTATGLGPRLLPRLRELETRALSEAAAGSLRPLVHEFPLAEAAAAHMALETRRTWGKVVLRP